MADPEGFEPDPAGFEPDAATPDGFEPDAPSAFQRGLQAAESPFKAAYGAMQSAFGLGQKLGRPVGRVAAIPIPGVDAAASAVQKVEGPAVNAVSGVLPWARFLPPSGLVRSFDTVGGAALNLAPEALSAGARLLAPAAEAAPALARAFELARPSYGVDPDTVVEAMDSAARERVPLQSLLTPQEYAVAQQAGDRLSFAKRMGVPYSSVLSPEESAMLVPTPPEPTPRGASPLPPATAAQPSPAGEPTPAPAGAGPGLPKGEPAPGNPSINLANFSAESRPIIQDLAQDARFGQGVVAARGPAVPQAVTRQAAADAIARGDLNVDDFIGASPRVLPDANLPQPVVVEASRQLGNQAAQDFQQAYQGWKSGKLPEEAAQQQAIRSLRMMFAAQGAGSETGRSLNILNNMSQAERAMAAQTRISLQTDLEAMARNDPGRFQAFMDQLAKLPTDAAAQRQVLAQKLLGKQGYWTALMRELRAVELTSNPATVAHIGLSQSIMAASQLLRRPIAGAIDSVLAPLTGAERSIYAGEVVPQAIAAVHAIPEAADMAMQRWLHGGGPMDTQSVLPAWTRLLLRTHDALKVFHETVAGAGEAAAQAYRAAIPEVAKGADLADRMDYWLRNPTRQMTDSAVNAMQEATFRQKLDPFTAGFKKTLLNNPIGRFFVPFVDIPTNVAKTIFWHTPGTAALMAGAPTGEISDAIAKNVVGLGGIMASHFALMHEKGLIDGNGPTDKRQRQDWLAAGNVPYSVRMPNGTRVPMRMVIGEAAAFPGAVADYMDYAKANPNATLMQRGGNILKMGALFLTHMPMAQFLGQLIDAGRDPDRSMKYLLHEEASSVVPPGVTLAKNFGVPGVLPADKTVRAPETTKQYMESRLPVLASRVPAKLDRFGAPIMSNQQNLGFTNSAPVDQLQKALLDNRLSDMVPMAPRELMGRKLDQQGKDEAIQATGPMMRRGLSALVLDPRFSALPDAQKQALVKEMVNAVRHSAAPGIQAAGVGNELRALGLPAQAVSPAASGVLAKVFAHPLYKQMGDDQRRTIVNRLLMSQGVR